LGEGKKSAKDGGWKKKKANKRDKGRKELPHKQEKLGKEQRAKFASR